MPRWISEQYRKFSMDTQWEHITLLMMHMVISELISCKLSQWFTKPGIPMAESSQTPILSNSRKNAYQSAWMKLGLEWWLIVLMHIEIIDFKHWSKLRGILYRYSVTLKPHEELAMLNDKISASLASWTRNCTRINIIPIKHLISRTAPISKFRDAISHSYPNTTINISSPSQTEHGSEDFQIVFKW